MSLSRHQPATSGTTPEPEELSRAVGALLGVIGGELFWPRGQTCGLYTDYPISGALLDLCHAYVSHRGEGIPVDVAAKHRSVHAPAWLLGVALVRSGVPDFVSDTLELATASGVPRRSLAVCVNYVELAVYLMAGWPTTDAIREATDIPIPNRSSAPRLLGEPEVDGLLASVWALSRAEPLDKVAAVLAATTTPGVRAAATGLVGLRDGDRTIPTGWRRLVPPAAEAMAVAPGLVRLQTHKEQPAP